MGGQNGKCTQSPDCDSQVPSEMNEEATAPEPMQQDPWFRARKFSEEDTTSVPQVEPWTKRLPRFSHLVHDPDLQMSDWTPEETDNWMRLNLAASVVWSMRTTRFSRRGEGQHIAGLAAAAAPCHHPTGPAIPKPLVIPTLPGDFFNFLEEEEEEEAEEEEEEDSDNSTNPAEKTPWRGGPQLWHPGYPRPDLSPELLPLSPSLSQGSEPPAQPSSTFTPPVFRACRRRLLF